MTAFIKASAASLQLLSNVSTTKYILSVPIFSWFYSSHFLNSVYKNFNMHFFCSNKKHWNPHIRNLELLSCINKTVTFFSTTCYKLKNKLTVVFSQSGRGWPREAARLDHWNQIFVEWDFVVKTTEGSISMLKTWLHPPGTGSCNEQKHSKI